MYSNLIALSQALNVTITAGMLRTAFITNTVTALEALAEADAVQLLATHQLQSTVLADGTAVDFAIGDDFGSHIESVCSDETELQGAIAIHLAVPSAQPIITSSVGDDYGLKENGDLKAGFCQVAKKDGTFRVFEVANKAFFQASQKKFVSKAIMEVSNFQRFEDGIEGVKIVNGAPVSTLYYTVQYQGTIFTKDNPRGEYISLRTNTEYTKLCQTLWRNNEGSNVDEYGVPQLEQGESMWLNLKVEDKVMKESAFETQNPAWLAEIESAGGEITLRRGKPTGYLKDRETSAQPSHKGFLAMTPQSQIQLTMKYLDTMNDEKAKNESLAEKLDIHQDSTIRFIEKLQGKMSEAQILAFVQATHGRSV